MTYANGDSISCEYEKFDSPVKIVYNDTGKIAKNDYSADGALAKVTYGTDTASDMNYLFEYDSSGRIVPCLVSCASLISESITTAIEESGEYTTVSVWLGKRVNSVAYRENQNGLIIHSSNHNNAVYNCIYSLEDITIVRKKKKYVLAEGYVVVVVMGLLTIFKLLLAPYARWPLPKGLAVVVMTFILFTCGRHYVFSETGIKAYLLGIRIRNVPWSDVGRLILFHNETARKKENYGVYLVVEKQNCNAPFLDDGNAADARSFFFMNPDVFRIPLYRKDPQITLDKIEQFRKIDDTYIWLRDE